MAKTGTQLITSIQDNIGGRPNGTIGIRSISDVILDKINDTIRHIVRIYPAPACDRRATIDITTSNFTYALPTTDVDDNTILIRGIYGVYGETTAPDVWPIYRKSVEQKLEHFPLVSSSLATGRPRIYNIFGSNIYFNVYPDANFTCNLWVNIWPVAIGINDEQPLGTPWDDVIEAGATALIYAALQQPDDYASWRDIYKDRRKEQLFAEREKPDWNPLRYTAVTSNDPQNDPFVQSYN